MTPDQFRTLLEHQFHGSAHYMTVWAKKLIRTSEARSKAVRPDELKLARAALAHIEQEGMA